ncbi:MAG: PepSY domain-containing protein [Pikeienuella sp.]|uniref:PepSY domain-containing protein n=1 Tax=Pikeienuella sp. TaxID=2831957 RepID=UPI00391D2E2C
MKPVLVAALFAVFAAPAHAGRGAPAADWAAIVSALTEQGYVSWEEIEVDREGNWNVDEARHGDGGVWELRLSPGDFAVIRRERDD